MIRSPFAFSVPDRTIIGLDERLTLVGEREVARTVNGRAVVLQPSYGSLYAVEVSNKQGLSLPPPALEIGDITTYDCQRWMTCGLGFPGAPIILPRNPVPGCVHARAPDGSVKPVVVTRRQVQVEADYLETFFIHWRMRLDVVVVDLDFSASATRREGSWSIRYEELDQIERLNPAFPEFPGFPFPEEPAS